MLIVKVHITDLKKKIAITGRQSLALTMHAFARDLVDLIDKNFEKEVDPRDNKWADLKPATWARKKTRKILTETGKLRKSIKVEGSRSGIKMSANVAYASYLQYGTAKMPARPFLDVSPKWLNLLRDRILKYIRGRAKREARK
jgi:phage gpG-like protein